MNENFLVIAKVKGVDYLVNVTADSLGEAEHVILDMGVCGRHCYSVQSSRAFDVKTMKSSTFIVEALSCSTVSFGEILEIIQNRNSEILAADKAEDDILAIKQKIKALKAELEQAEKTFNSFEVMN